MRYFLVKDRRFGMDNYVFTRIDPREDGYKGDDVIENVRLDYDMNEIHLWPDGQPRPNPKLGRDPNDPYHYKVFKFPEELNNSRFEFVHMNTPTVVYSWSDYRKRFYPRPEEYAEQMTQDEWFDFLEEADAAAKIRKSLNQSEEPKPGSSRDEIAEWVARQHMGADGAVHHIWYLPSGSASDEIRLLEVSDRFLPEGAPIKPTPVNVDILGRKFRLQIADATSSQIDGIQQNPLNLLPPGWSLENPKIWSRRDLP